MRIVYTVLFGRHLFAVEEKICTKLQVFETVGIQIANQKTLYHLLYEPPYATNNITRKDFPVDSRSEGQTRLFMSGMRLAHAAAGASQHDGLSSSSQEE